MHSTGRWHHLPRQLNDVERSLVLLKEKIDPLIPSPSLDSCLVLQLDEQVGSRKIDLSEVTCPQKGKRKIYWSRNIIFELMDRLISSSTPENES